MIRQFVSRKSVALIFGSLGFVGLGMLFYKINNPAPSPFKLPTYFFYSENDFDALEELPSDKIIAEAEVDHWVQVVFDLVKQNKKEIDVARVYAYLFTAQQDAVSLSYQVKKRLAGNLTAVSTKTLCLLLPEECSLIPPADEPDAYSLKLAEIVTQKVNERLQEEEKIITPYTISKTSHKWVNNQDYFGRSFGHEKPWLLATANQFRLSAPEAYGSRELYLQREELKKILASLTQNQIDVTKQWAAGAGTISTAGQWIEFAHTYMKNRKIPLEQAMHIQAILAMGMADATIAYSDSKYTYWKPRPEMVFPDLKGSIRTPNHPSYPSGHATTAMAAAIIMDHYFPENQVQWDKTAHEIAESRLWGLVHFPVDHYDGLALGRKIGEWIVSKIK